MQAGYKRSVTSLYKMLVKLGIYNKVPSKKKKYEPKTCMTKELIERNESSIIA